MDPAGLLSSHLARRCLFLTALRPAPALGLQSPYVESWEEVQAACLYGRAVLGGIFILRVQRWDFGTCAP